MSKTIIALCGRGVDPYWDFEGYTLLEFEVGINADRRFFLSGEVFLNCNRTFIYLSLLKGFCVQLLVNNQQKHIKYRHK